MTNTTVVNEFLAAIEHAAIPDCDAWSADATLDATVPNWRLHRATIRDGRIVADTVLCGGRWPAALLAEMEAADA
jgi:hypothetical protein